jgi:hypothetical protein
MSNTLAIPPDVPVAISVLAKADSGGLGRKSSHRAGSFTRKKIFMDKKNDRRWREGANQNTSEPDIET